MIQLGNTDGQTEIIVTWRTYEKSDSRVDYGANYELTITDQNLTDRHEILINRLKPNSSYPYRIFSDGRWLTKAVFQTSKSEDQPFWFAVLGDSGSGRIIQYAVARRLEKQNPDFILHTGDLVYLKGEDKKYFRRFYGPYKKSLKRIPFFPSLGNHDYHNLEVYLQNFVLPDSTGEERYYSFDYGNAHIVILDSNRIDEFQTEWLEKELVNSRKLWNFVVFHHPPFSNCLKDSRYQSGDVNVREFWMPLFEKYGVDIVFLGHNHIYTRYKPRNGVVYIVEGVGGASLYTAQWIPEVDFTDDEHYGFGLVEIDNGHLIFKHITSDGEILDEFSLFK